MSWAEQESARAEHELARVESGSTTIPGVGSAKHFTAVCRCGWISRPCQSTAGAEREHDEHRCAV